MEKSELMKRFEEETGMDSYQSTSRGVVYNSYYIKWLESQLMWNLASELPEKDQIVIATYLNQWGKRRRVRAVYIRQYEEEESGPDDESCVEYCEEQDEWYIKEGWYELIDNWDTYSSVVIVEGKVDHWLPMPKYIEVE